MESPSNFHRKLEKLRLRIGDSGYNLLELIGGSTPMADTIYEASPSMGSSHPTRFLIVLTLCFVGVGIPVLLFWWLYVRGQRLIITERSSIYRKGIFFKSTSEILHRDVRKVQVSQSSLQRKLRAGNITISGQNGMEITIKGITLPEHLKAIVNTQRVGEAQATSTAS